MSWHEEFYRLLCANDSGTENIGKAYELKNKNLPKAIYKYRETNEKQLDNFLHDRVWLSNPANFNDPFDSLLTVDYENIIKKRFLKTLLEKAKKDSKVPAEILDEALKSDDPYSFLFDFASKMDGTNTEENEKFKKEFKKEQDWHFNNLRSLLNKALRDSFKVCSFSARRPDDSPLSLLMWAHYADSHKGFCIEYDLSTPNVKDFNYRFLYPVMYSDNLFDASEFMENIRLGNFNNLYWKKTALSKSTIWTYEMEWRLLYDAGVIKNDQALNFLKTKTVYLGLKIPIEDEKKIIEIAGHKKIPVFKMIELQNTFGLEAKQIS